MENIEVISRYGSDEAGATLDKLGGAGWQGRRARIKKRLKDMAEALLRIAAARHIKHTDMLAAPEGVYNEFAAGFQYAETDDQLRAIENVGVIVAERLPSIVDPVDSREDYLRTKKEKMGHLF